MVKKNIFAKGVLCLESKWVSEIKGFEQCEGYKIYEDGRVESYKDNHGNIHNEPKKVLKGYPNTKGYLLVDLRPKRAIKIHRLVACAFIDNPFNKPQVNHIDGNKNNNHCNNLEWVTNSENQIHANKIGLRKPAKGEDNYQYNSEHKNCKKVRQLTLDGEEVSVFNSLAMAGRSIGKGYSLISGCCNGKCQTAYGFRWEFVNT